MSSEQINGQLRTVALTALATRYYINTSTEHAEKMGLMAYIGAKKAKDDIWQLVSGNLLAGPNPTSIEMLMTEVYGKQDKLVKKGKQDILNEEHRQHVQALLKIPE